MVERLKERPVYSLARRLKATESTLCVGNYFFPEVQGIKLTYPYHEIAHVSYNTIISDNDWANYKAMKDLFSGELPEHWISYIKEVAAIRKQRGCSYPLDLVSAAYFTVRESPERIAQLGLPTLETTPSGEDDLSNIEGVKAVVDGILNDEILREKMTGILAVLIPDVGGVYLDQGPVNNFLEKRGCNGIFLDLGSGTGVRTTKWAKKFKSAIALERQFHPDFYNAWLDKSNGVNFLRGDFARGIPILNDSVDVVLMESVVPHITAKALADSLKQALSVLKPNGFLFIGPQHHEYNWRTKKGDGSWRCFIKAQDKEGNWYFKRERME